MDKFPSALYPIKLFKHNIDNNIYKSKKNSHSNLKCFSPIYWLNNTHSPQNYDTEYKSSTNYN
jgi:hypothetical protein